MRWQRGAHRLRQPLLALSEEDDHRAVRRLLERLEEGVRRLHMKGVGGFEDRDSAGAAVGRERENPLKTPDLADAQVAAVRVVAVLRLVAEAARRDELDVRVAGRVGVATGAALAAGGRRACAVQSSGEVEGGRRLADALRAAEQVGVGRAAARQRPLERG